MTRSPKGSKFCGWWMNLRMRRLTGLWYGKRMRSFDIFLNFTSINTREPRLPLFKTGNLGSFLHKVFRSGLERPVRSERLLVARVVWTEVIPYAPDHPSSQLRTPLTVRSLYLTPMPDTFRRRVNWVFGPLVCRLSGSLSFRTTQGSRRYCFMGVRPTKFCRL